MLMVKMNAVDYCFMRLYLLVFLVFIHVLNGIIQVTGHELKVRPKSWTNKEGQLGKETGNKMGLLVKAIFLPCQMEKQPDQVPHGRWNTRKHGHWVRWKYIKYSNPKTVYFLTNHMKHLKLFIFESSYLSCSLHATKFILNT